MKFKNYIEVQSGIKDSADSPGTLDQVLTSTATGVAWVDPSTISAEAATLVAIECKNTSGATITKGTPVYQTGTVGATDVIEIAPADALISAGKQPAIGLLQTTLNNNGFGKVVITGEFLNFTTDPIDGVTPTTGDKVFLKSGGGLTLTKPTGAENGIQNLGLIGKVSGGNAGSITVSSIMRTNDVPNLPTGKIWVGDGNTTVSDTVFLDEPNGRMGIGTTSPSQKLHVAGDMRLTGAFRDGVNSQGSANYVLTSTGSNSTRWVDASTVIGGPYLPLSAGSSYPLTGALYLGNVGGDQKIQFQRTGGNVYSIEHDSAQLYFYNRTTTESPLIIQNDGDVLMNAGNVGIGTTSPGAKLHVDGTAIFDTQTGAQPFYITRSGVANQALKIYVDDQAAVFESIQDEAADDYGSFIFKMDGGTTHPYFDIRKGNATQVRFDGSGNVGIGTTGPGAKLDIVGSTIGLRIKKPDLSDVLRVYTQGSGVFVNNGNFHVEDNVGIGTTNPTNKLQVTGGSVGIDSEYMVRDNRNNTILLQSASTAASNRSLTIGNATYSNIIVPNGNVGIGTTSPAQKLDVVGYIRSANTGTDATTKYSGFFGRHYTNSEEDVFAIATEATSTNNNVYIGGGFSTRNSATTIRFTTAANNTTTIGSERMRITSTGNVGIGTTSPGAKLHISSPDETVARFERSSGSGYAVLDIKDGVGTTGNSTVRFSDTAGSPGEINYEHADDSLRINTNSSERIRITSGGNVGIGTTSPQEKLDISAGNIRLDDNQTVTWSSADANIGRVRITGNEVNDYLLFATDNSERMRLTNTGLGVGTTSPSSKLHVFNAGYPQLSMQSNGGTWQVGVSTGNDLAFRIGTSGSNYPLWLDSSSNVGIGTTSPGNKLTISGPSSNQFEIINSTNSKSWRPNVNGNDFYITESGVGNSLVIQAGGNVGIGTVNPTYKLEVHANTAGSNRVRVINASTGQSSVDLKTSQQETRIIAVNNKPFYIYDQSQSSELFTILTGGNVGIGTTAPSQKLHVAGNMRLQNQLYDSTNSAGTNGEVLTKVSAGTEWKVPAVNAQMPDNTAPASAANVGTIRYRSTSNTSFMDMSMQTGATTYAWVNIVSNFW